ncbi:MAG: stage II sporulation protein M [Thiolinea sp.]
MKQSQFVEQNERLWQLLEAWLDRQQTPAKKQRKMDNSPAEVADEIDFPAAYRQLCHHLALAQSRMYSPLLIERLNQLVIRGHHQLYSTRMHFWHHVADFFLRGFPQLIRREWKVVALSALLFFGSFFAMVVAIQIQPELVYTVVSGEQVAQMEQMYDPEQHSRLGRIREADSDVMMFGFYIRNNTGIGFQVFAGGLLYGLGSVFFLLYNGLVIGAAAGHLTHIGYIETFWGFVSGHSAFELTAIALSGAAGFKLAQALLMPGRKSRRLALLDNSKIAIRIIYGSATLFIMAAFVEAFWSSLASVPVIAKYATGLILWTLLISYFTRVGRNS